MSRSTEDNKAQGPEPLRGNALLTNPLINKGSAFTATERKELGLEGLLPAAISTQAQQVERIYATISGLGTPLQKYRELTALQDRSEYLYYRLLMENLAEFMPIVYTPTVGEATQKYSQVFQRGRGIWITPDHRGRVAEILANGAAGRDIGLMVVTDNESILGIGDQGAGGMAISIGKLSLYTASAGIAPELTLPVSLDVGTNNQELLDNPNYLGWHNKRITGHAYYELVEEFVQAVKASFPNALVQWEDFRKDNALKILDKYRDSVLSFNDDIQGTGAVTLAGIFSAMRITKQPINEQRFVIHGAGAAGLGIARQIKAALRSAGIADNKLDHHIALLDSRGLLVDDQKFTDSYKQELAWPAAHATEIGLTEDRGLAACVAAFKPTVLIGTSGQAGAFNKAIVTNMADNCDRPVILPLSNPTSNAEAQPRDLLEWTQGRAIIATGSPFEPVEFEGATHQFGQGNNVFIFPALGLAAMATKAKRVTDDMITQTAQALADQVTQAELDRGMLYPEVDRLREVTTVVAVAAAQEAFNEGIASIPQPNDLQAFIEDAMWHPDYA